MEMLKQINFLMALIAISSFKSLMLAQDHKIQLVANDSTMCNVILPSKTNFHIVVDELFLKPTFWPNGNIGSVLIKSNDSLIIKLGYNYSGKLINQSEYKIIHDSLVAHGIHYHYSDDGFLSHSYTYLNGVLNGLYRSYYQTGDVEIDGSYLHGEKNGIWRYYSSKRKLIKKEKWINGVQ